MQKSDIRKISSAKLKDAEILLVNGRYDGAVYICGYAIELGLKNQICKKLKWSEYPPGNNRQNYRSFITHNLEILLSLTGKENLIKTKYFAEWSVVTQWSSEMRYNAIGKILKMDADSMIKSTKILLKQL